MVDIPASASGRRIVAVTAICRGIGIVADKVYTPSVTEPGIGLPRVEKTTAEEYGIRLREHPVAVGGDIRRRECAVAYISERLHFVVYLIFGAGVRCGP